MLIKTLMHAGIKSTDGPSLIRAKKISNLIVLTSVINALIGSILFWYLGDPYLSKILWLINFFFTSAYILSLLGFSNIGRPLSLLSGNCAVFYTACIFRGHSGLELFFFTLSVAPFMYFSWVERRWYLMSIIGLSSCFIGEYGSWEFFEAYQHDYDLKAIRVFCVLAVMNQIILGFYYFLKQSNKFENDSLDSLSKLDLEYQKQLQVQKMSSLGEMASGISHEINNPLMVILGNSNLLQKKLKNSIPKDVEVSYYFEKIDSTVHHISKIILALKNFSRNSINDPVRPIQLKNIFEMTLDLCHDRFNSTGLTLTVEIEEDIIILSRPSEISQVLLNLLNNAYDAINGMGNGEVKIKGRKIFGSAEILVEDNGSGIADEIKDKIMQPFFTTKDVDKGTGLGLSISKGLIESHQGTLQLIPTLERRPFKLGCH